MTYPPLSLEAFEQQCARHSLKIPGGLRKFLMSTNGATCSDGYFRIFGIGEGAAIDSVHWNAIDTWKFAWPAHVRNYWCFGETPWGDQYSFKIDESGEQVFLLDAVAMQPEPIAENFEEFYRLEFLRNVESPYDEFTKEAQSRFGSLDVSEHLIHTSSILISHAEKIELVQKSRSVDAMVINGDLYSQIGEELVSRPIKEVEAFVDANGRARARVRWLAT